MPTNLMRAKPLVFDNNDEEQMEIKNENENIQEPLTNEPGCSNDHHFRRVKTAVAEGQKNRPSGGYEDQQWYTHRWLKTRNIGIKNYTAADLKLMKDSLLITCVTKKLCLAKLVVLDRILFHVLAKSTEIQKG
ncbi:hypothetical protein T11_5580 [Trichinella zimbabwensis]|uniref:Uncharacterized protein n=1 Tax=Trichinella zimbabwensis TaxID=268475 RepID=A0A0V1GTW9_9BILA|nr:hypothetical protein T11_5580 [Trichinella zimbabwensis]